MGLLRGMGTGKGGISCCFVIFSTKHFASESTSLASSRSVQSPVNRYDNMIAIPVQPKRNRLDSKREERRAKDQTLKVSVVSRILSRAVRSVGHSNPTHSSVAAVVINPSIPSSSVAFFEKRPRERAWKKERKEEGKKRRTFIPNSKFQNLKRYSPTGRYTRRKHAQNSHAYFPNDDFTFLQRSTYQPSSIGRPRKRSDWFLMAFENVQTRCGTEIVDYRRAFVCTDGETL